MLQGSISAFPTTFWDYYITAIPVGNGLLCGRFPHVHKCCWALNCLCIRSWWHLCAWAEALPGTSSSQMPGRDQCCICVHVCCFNHLLTIGQCNDCTTQREGNGFWSRVCGMQQGFQHFPFHLSVYLSCTGASPLQIHIQMLLCKFAGVGLLCHVLVTISSPAQ